ncbi:MAG: chromosome segregation protein SMC [DPANN group archaeon]|nr:chromosome segregation protein SMC [DPANN group archaeon]
MKTFISGLNLRGFKSFGKTTQLQFGPGLNAVIGPNGSGKSNVLDGFCFILGRMSSKDLRAENFSDLIFKKKSNTASEADTAIYLDNSAGVFPMQEKQIEIKRKIKKDGGTQYKINSKNSTRGEVLELLSLVRVHPEGHNIILQGDIAHFVEMKPLEKRQLVEEVAGIGVYEERKNKALAELAKVDDKLKEAGIILREKENYMKNLEEEKKGAERYRSMQAELKGLRAAEIKLRTDLTNTRKNKTLSEIEKQEQAVNNLGLEVEITKKKIGQFRNNIERLEKEIQKKGGEEAQALQKEIEGLKVSAEKSRLLISNSRAELQKADARKADWSGALAELETKIKNNEKNKTELEKELTLIKKRAEPSKKGESDSELAELEKDAKRLDEALKDLSDEREKANTAYYQIQSNMKILEHELKSAEEELKKIEKDEEKFSDVKDAKNRFKKISDEISALASRDSKLALDTGELHKELIKKEEEFAKARAHASSISEMLQRDQAVKEIAKKKMPGVLGTIAELGKVDKEYAEALKIAAGARMKNIVTESVDVAIKCLQVLKDARAGTATFLPLDKISAGQQVEASTLKKSGVIGLAHNLITCESKYKNLFKYIFRNTLVVESIQTARSLGVGKYRMVTLDGDLFEQSGAITGGFREKGAGIGFEQTEMQGLVVKLEADLSVINKNIKQMQAEREKLQEKISGLRGEKAELEGKAVLAKEIYGEKEKEKLRKKQDDLEKQKSDLQKKLAEAESERTSIESKLKTAAQERNELSLRARDLQFGGNKKAIEELLAKKSDVESQLATITAALDNSLRPELERIEKNLKHLEKEKKEFEKQIVDEESQLKKLEKDINGKETDEEKFHAKIKELFANKNQAGTLLRETESQLNEHMLKISQAEQAKNNFAIEKAQYEAELAGLKQEFEPFTDITLAEVKNIEDAKKKIKSVNDKLQSLGSINMRALEVFEAVQQEYENLASRTNKLQAEKNDVLGVIDEIEKKKKDAFIGTYEKIAEKFMELHAKIADKNHATLELENPENPFGGGVLVKIIDAKGRRTSLTSLSGGEKTLAALAFIFAIQEHEPAPFYLLDEIDAALDKVNSERVARLLKEYSQKAQVIIVTHNDAVISESDSIYGVSMTKDGWSNVVSVKI